MDFIKLKGLTHTVCIISLTAEAAKLSCMRVRTCDSACKDAGGQ